MNPLARLFGTTIGKKILMAVSGLALFGFLVTHLAGNLLVFAGPEAINAYSHALWSRPGLLWAARSGLLVFLLIHVITTIQLYQINKAARGRDYAVKENPATTYAARTMILGGPLLFLYIVYHLLHFTFGSAHPDFIHGDPYHNVMVAFQNPLVTGVYVLAMLILGMHLRHGLWSFMQTLGLNHPSYNDLREKFAFWATVIMIGGYLSIPLAVALGVLR